MSSDEDVENEMFVEEDISSDEDVGNEKMSTNLFEEMQARVDENISAGGLRQYFISQLVLAVQNHIHPEKLQVKRVWDRFCFEMSQDRMENNQNEEVAIGLTYSLLDAELFKNTGKHINYFPNLYPTHLFDATKDETPDEFSTFEEEANRLYRKLNEDQENAYDVIMAAVNDKPSKPRCYFLSGPAGSGKTYVYKAIVYTLLSQRNKVICCAPTGIAATLLPHGMTCHKAFDLPIEFSKYPRFDRKSTIYPGSAHAEMLKDASVIIIDEITMLQRWQFEYIDQMLRFLMHKEELPFGGKLILAGGDFRQLEPVKPQRSELGGNVKTACDPNGLNLWNKFERLMLRKNMRAKNPKNEEFARFLDKIGNGVKNSNCSFVKMPEQIIAKEALHKDIFQELYVMNYMADEDTGSEDFESIANKAILAPTNKSVDNWNKEVVEMLPFKDEHFLACDKDEYGNMLQYNDNKGRLPGLITLRKYSTIMLLCNLDVQKGLCNGARFRYIEEGNKFLKCVHLTGVNTGKTALIPLIRWPIFISKGKRIYRTQYPVRLAFAITIHKAQGQTFDKVGVDLTDGMFAHGLMYVALSRVAKFNDLRVSHNTADLLNEAQQNKVYQNLIS